MLYKLIETAQTIEGWVGRKDRQLDAANPSRFLVRPSSQTRNTASTFAELLRSLLSYLRLLATELAIQLWKVGTAANALPEIRYY